MKKLFFDIKNVKSNANNDIQGLRATFRSKILWVFHKKKLKNSAKCIKNKFAKDRKINESNKNP